MEESKSYIKEIRIENYKCFKEFNLKLKKGVNIIVGNNEAGKSTILEAINLALSGFVSGKYIKTELTQHLFNKEVIKEYLEKINNVSESGVLPPKILIEIFLEGNEFPELKGNGNYKSDNTEQGISFVIDIKKELQGEYEELIKSGDIDSLPIEYYNFSWSSFAREPKTPRAIPIKSALIDSSSNRYLNGSDVYISRIIKDCLSSEDIIKISKAHRNLKESFSKEEAVKLINAKIQEAIKISNKKVELAVDLSTKNAWENNLITCLDEIPFHHIGKGEQCIVKTKLALSHKKAREANILLLEEPENHLSHTKLNQLIKDIKEDMGNKQLIISTHNSYVANKLGLNDLIILNNGKTTCLSELSLETKEFFDKLAGYDTLRFLLCKKAILVEGDSDELILQKAYMENNDGKLPIEDEIDVISVNISFLRFLEIAEKINQSVSVVTDNDGDIEAIKRKYENYLGNNSKEGIKIFYDEIIDTGELKISENKFNYNTLEPKLLKENSLILFNKIFETEYTEIDDLHKYMKREKTRCALNIFSSQEEIVFPKYILDAIEDNDEE